MRAPNGSEKERAGRSEGKCVGCEKERATDGRSRVRRLSQSGRRGSRLPGVGWFHGPRGGAPRVIRRFASAGGESASASARWRLGSPTFRPRVGGHTTGERSRERACARARGCVRPCEREERGTSAPTFRHVCRVFARVCPRLTNG